MEGNPHRRKRRLNKGKIKRALLLSFCLYALCMMVNIVIYQERARAEQLADERDLIRQIQEAKAVNEELRQRIEFAGTNAYIERMAREHLGYVGEGEIKFVEGETPSATAAQQPQTNGDGE